MNRSLNTHRAWRGLEGPLSLLFAKGKGQFDLRLGVADDWSAWPLRSEDEQSTTAYFVAQIEETGDAQRDAAVRVAILGSEGAPAATDFAVGGEVYKILPKFTRAPSLRPRRWELRGYLIAGVRWPANG